MADDRTKQLEAEFWRSVRDAPKWDLSAQAAKLVATGGRLDRMLVEGAEFRRMSPKKLERLPAELDRVKAIVTRVQEQIVAQSKIREA